jgi:acetyl-CoA carboxylase carboxyltransferase component
MGGAQAAGVMAYVKDKARARQGKPPLTAEEKEKLKAPIVEAFDSNSSAYNSTAEVYDDGIIDPRSTRTVLAKCLSVTLNAPLPETSFGVFRM